MISSRRNKMEGQDNINQKNITDKWLDNVFEILMRLEGYERLAKEGCSSLIEYVQNPQIQIDMAQIQKKNYDFFITEFEVLLNNIRHLIDAKTYLKMQIKLNHLFQFENNVGGFLELKVDMMQHKEWYVLSPEFYDALRDMSLLRGIAVSSLWKMLSPNAKENFEGLPR